MGNNSAKLAPSKSESSRGSLQNTNSWSNVSNGRGELVRLLAYSPAGDWSEVEASSLTHHSASVPSAAGYYNQTTGSSHSSINDRTNNSDHNASSSLSTKYRRGWVPTSYLTPANVALPVGGGNQTSAPFIPTNHQSPQPLAIPDHHHLAAAAAQQSQSEQLSSFAWFHGPVSRQTGEQLLRSGITGSFLVRASESAPGQLSVTVRHLGRVYHYRVNQDSHGMFYITEAHRFANVVQLIDHHSRSADGLVCPLLYPVPVQLANTTPSSMLHSRVLSSKDAAPPTELDAWEIDRSEIVMRQKLGGGQYGDVYEALWRRCNLIVAVKTLKQDINLNVTDFLKEAAIMKKLRHQNLVQLIGVCTRDPPLYLITEYMPHGNLLHYLRQHGSPNQQANSPETLTPPVLLYMALQIACGMAYLEAHNFIHRDLAARNCLVGEQNLIKVADFGLARYAQLHDTYTARNGAKFPIKWTAPEGLAFYVFSSKSDVWAFGVVLWELATYGQSPYPGVELHDVYHLLEQGQRMTRPFGCPEAIYAVMLRCWEWDPNLRPSFAEVHVQIEQMYATMNIEAEVALDLAKQQLPSPSASSINSNVAAAPIPHVDPSRFTHQHVSHAWQPGQQPQSSGPVSVPPQPTTGNGRHQEEEDDYSAADDNEDASSSASSAALEAGCGDANQHSDLLDDQRQSHSSPPLSHQKTTSQSSTVDSAAAATSSRLQSTNPPRYYISPVVASVPSSSSGQPAPILTSSSQPARRSNSAVTVSSFGVVSCGIGRPLIGRQGHTGRRQQQHVKISGGLRSSGNRPYPISASNDLPYTPDESGVGESIVSTIDSPGDSGRLSHYRTSTTASASAAVRPRDDHTRVSSNAAAADSGMPVGGPIITSAQSCGINPIACATTNVVPPSSNCPPPVTMPVQPNQAPTTNPPPPPFYLFPSSSGHGQLPPPQQQLSAPQLDQFSTMAPQDRIGRYLQSLQADESPTPCLFNCPPPPPIARGDQVFAALSALRSHPPPQASHQLTEAIPKSTNPPDQSADPDEDDVYQAPDQCYPQGENPTPSSHRPPSSPLALLGELTSTLTQLLASIDKPQHQPQPDNNSCSSTPSQQQLVQLLLASSLDAVTAQAEALLFANNQPATPSRSKVLDACRALRGATGEPDSIDRLAVKPALVDLLQGLRDLSIASSSSDSTSKVVNGNEDTTPIVFGKV